MGLIPPAPVPIRFRKDAATDLNAAMDQMFDVFPDQYPVLIAEDALYWTLGRTWPGDSSWYVDPNIERNATRLYGCGLRALAAYSTNDVVAGIPFILTMFHSRALFGPALARILNGVQAFGTIIHIDDHADALPCLLSAHPKGLFESTSGVPFDLDSVGSVQHAIDEGAVNIGNFLTAYMLGKPAGRFIHVKHDLRWAQKPLVPSARHVQLGADQLESTELEPDVPLGGERWVCEEMPQVPLDLATDQGAVWLDVDMDAFCNRYDGDSDRRAVAATELERGTARRRIEEFLSRLRCASWVERIGAVSLAASPGFFPSDLWEEMIPIVHTGIAAVLITARA